MSKLTPITAKVQKGTKGGMIKQPLLNMGAPVKMKYSNKPMLEKKGNLSMSSKSIEDKSSSKEPNFMENIEINSENKNPKTSARKAYRSGQISKSQKKSIIAEEKAMKKDSMAKKKKC